MIDGWFYTLEEEVIRDDPSVEEDGKQLLSATMNLMEQRLENLRRTAPSFSACLRAYRESLAENDHARAEGLLAWLSGQPNVNSSVKRAAGIKGDIDHFGALSFLQGLLLVARDAGHPGFLVVLDEVETLQRVRSDVRDKARPRFALLHLRPLSVGRLLRFAFGQKIWHPIFSARNGTSKYSRSCSFVAELLSLRKAGALLDYTPSSPLTSLTGVMMNSRIRKAAEEPCSGHRVDLLPAAWRAPTRSVGRRPFKP